MTDTKTEKHHNKIKARIVRIKEKTAKKKRGLHKEVKEKNRILTQIDQLEEKIKKTEKKLEAARKEEKLCGKELSDVFNASLDKIEASFEDILV